MFSSQTDTEVVAHLVNHALKTAPNLLVAVQQVVPQLKVLMLWELSIPIIQMN